MALGSTVIPEGVPARGVLSVLTGLSVIAGLTGWLLPFPVHYRVTYLIVLLALVFLRWRAIGEMLRPMSAAWRGAVVQAPVSACFAVLVVGIVTTCAWLPTVHYDDLAYHLGLPSQLASLGYYKMDAGSDLWAMSAWAADVLQGVVGLIAGHVSRGMLDASWLVLALVLMWQLCATLELPPWICWLSVALYASLPLTAGALTGMQTEGPTAAVVVGIAFLIQRSRGPDRRQLLALALLFGLLLALKVSNLMIAGPLGLWLLCRWRLSLPWRALPLALLLAVLVAGSSYVYAWALAGNPVLPVFNAIFHSHYYTPTNFHDDHWNAGFHWNILWNVVFHTSRYGESGDGTGGFVLIALMGGLLGALFNRRVRPLALVALGSFLLPLTQVQYLRYAHQALILMIPAMLCGIPMLAAGSRRVPEVALSLTVLVIAQLVFVPAGDWQLRHGELKDYLTQPRADFIDHYAPMSKMIDVVHERYGSNARVLITSSTVPFAAGFAGRAFVRNWYDQQLAGEAAQADQDATGREWASLMEKVGANLLVLRVGDVSPGLATAVATAQADLVYQVGDLQLWEVRHVIAGVRKASQADTVSVQFATSTLPQQPTLAKATLILRCKPRSAPIALTWKIAQGDAKPWLYSEWAYCLPDGKARATLNVSVPHPITGFMVSAHPVKPIDMDLGLVSSMLDVREDFGEQRDLASQMRWRLRSMLADWIDPWSAHGILRAGTSSPSPTGVVTVRFGAAEAPPHAALVHAAVTLKCHSASVPIVMSWKISEQDAAPLSRYEWAWCGEDGLTHALFEAKVRHRITSFTVTAAPSQAVDMNLQLLTGEYGYLINAGIRGAVFRKRIKLARWLTPDADVRRVTQ
jgi:hypothetical protein